MVCEDFNPGTVFPSYWEFIKNSKLYYCYLKYLYDGGITPGPSPGGSTTKSYHISFMNVLNNTLPTTLDTSTVKYGIINDSVSSHHVIAFKDNNISTVHYTKDDVFYVDTLLYYQNGNYSYFEPPNMEIRQVDPDTLDETVLLNIPRSSGGVGTATNSYRLWAINAFNGLLPPNPPETVYILIKETGVYNLYRMQNNGTLTSVNLTSNDLLFVYDDTIIKASNTDSYTPANSKTIFKVNDSRGSIMDPLLIAEKPDNTTLKINDSGRSAVKISTTPNNRLIVDSNGLFVGDQPPAKEDTQLNITYPKFYYGDDVTVTVRLSTKDTNLPIAGRTVRLNGENLPVTNINGETTKTFTYVLNPNIELTANFSGDTKYNASSVTVNLRYTLHTEILAPPVVIENVTSLFNDLDKINNNQVISIVFGDYSTITPFSQTNIQINNLVNSNYLKLQFNCAQTGKLDLVIDEVINGVHSTNYLCELGNWQPDVNSTMFEWYYDNKTLTLNFQYNLAYLTPTSNTAVLIGTYQYFPKAVVQLPITLNEIKGSNKTGIPDENLLITDNNTVKGYFKTDDDGKYTYILTNVTTDHTINIKYNPDSNPYSHDPAETITSITLHDSALIDTHFVNSDVTYPANSSVKMEVIVIDSNDAVPTQGKVQITENGVTSEYPVGNIEYTPNTTSTHNMVLNYIDNGSPLKYNNCSKTITVNIQTQKITPVITATAECKMSSNSWVLVRANLKLSGGTCLPDRWLIAHNDNLNVTAPQGNDCSVPVSLNCAPVVVGDTIDVIYDPDSQPNHPEDAGLYNKVTKTVTVVGCDTPTDIVSDTFEVTTTNGDYDIDSTTFNVDKIEGSGKLTSSKFEVNES